MAQDLISFLAENPIENLQHEIKLGGRLKEFTFKIKPMSGKQFYDYQKIATKLGTNKSLEFNTAKFNELVVLNHLVEPNLRNVELLSSLNVATPEQCLYKYFLGGELVELAEKISEISGFNTTDKELEDEVKNS